MLMRNLKSDFVGGAYVFPGGAVDPRGRHRRGGPSVRRDSMTASPRRCWGSKPAASRTGSPALRELFEEAGLLLAATEGGAPLDAGDVALAARLVEHRREVNDGTRRFLDVLAAEALVLDGSALSYFAHWITPVGPPRRYDTRFFVAAAPAGQVPVHDDKELVANTWVTPAEALERHRAGRHAADLADDQEPRGDRAVRVRRRALGRGARRRVGPDDRAEDRGRRERRADPAPRRRRLRRRVARRRACAAPSATQAIDRASGEAPHTDDRPRRRCPITRSGPPASRACPPRSTRS